jgi:hypothetical protein
VAIKRKLSIATIRLYFLSDLSYRSNNTNFVYCHEMRFRTKFHRRCLGKLLNRVKLHVHNSRIIFLVNYTVKLNLCCNLQIKKVRSIATTYFVALRSKLSIATTSFVAIKRKLSIATKSYSFSPVVAISSNMTIYVIPMKK